MVVVQHHAGRLGHSLLTPQTWGEAAELVARDPLDTSVCGGATYLMWRAAHGERMPGVLVSLHRIADHDEVTDGSIGALASLRHVERGPATGAQRALTMAASVTAGPAVRTLATVGGNIASGFPQADLVPSLLALDAELEFDDGSRQSMAEVVERGLTTERLITRVTHQLAGEEGWTGATIKLSRRGMDLSVGTVSAVVRLEGDEIVDARVAVGSLHDRPARLLALGSALVGADPSEATIREVVEVVGVAGRSYAEDAQASAAYRSRVAAPLVRRAITLAIRLGGDGQATPTDALA